MENKYRLKTYPNSSLREKSFPVLNMDNGIINLIESMTELMYAKQGVGLAAPQIGELKRIIIADIGDGLLSLVNPVILYSEGQDFLTEGCLSLPGIEVGISRSTKIMVSGITPESNEVNLLLSGLMARVVQHEIDHLNGVLIIDYQEETKFIF